MKLLFIDTETTNLENGLLVQLAYSTANSFHSISQSIPVNEYFKPNELISYDAMAVHHITNEMVYDKPFFVESKEKKELEKLREDHVFIAHNAKFDLEVLKREGLEFPLWIDTKRVAMHLLDSNSYKLQYLRYFLHLNIEGEAHDALTDVFVLEKLFKHLYSLAEQRLGNSDFESIINYMMTLSNNPVILRNLNFGKYYGKSYAEVLEFDRGYLAWLYNSEMTKLKSEQNEDLIHTLQFLLKSND